MQQIFLTQWYVFYDLKIFLDICKIVKFNQVFNPWYILFLNTFLFIKTVYVINYWLEFFARSQTLIFLVNFCQLIWSNFFLWLFLKEVDFSWCSFKWYFYSLYNLPLCDMLNFCFNINVYVIRLFMQTCQSNSFNSCEVYINIPHILTRIHSETKLIRTLAHSIFI